MSASGPPAIPSIVTDEQRLAALRQYAVLDTPPEQAFDDITRLTAAFCDAPIALVSFVDRGRQWFKSEVGLGARETPIDVSVCAHALAGDPSSGDDLFVVPDTAGDARFADSPLVTGDPHMRFYAGAVLRDPRGHALGTLCVLDRRPRQLTDAQAELLRAMARQVMAQLELRRTVADLRESEGRFRQLADAMPQIVFAADADGRVDYFNRRWYEFTGLAADGQTGQDRWATAHDPDHLPAVVAAWEAAIRGGTPYEMAYPLRRHDGAWRWHLARAAPIRDEAGRVVRWYGTNTDVDDQRRAADALARGREQMELVVRGANVGVWYCPLPFDKLIWDPTVKAHFHLSPDAAVTIDTFYARIHPADRDRTRRAIDASIAGRTPYDIDYRTVSEDGRVVHWIRAVGRGYYDAAGNPTRFDGITVDVTARATAEADLRASEERFRLATRATNDGIWDWNLQTDAVWWNVAVTHLFGYAPDQMEPTAAWWVAQIHPDDRPAVTADIHAVIADPSREHWEGEYRFRRRDGSWAEVFDRGYVLRDAAGRGVRMLGAMQDRTRQKALEREREATIEAERRARAEAERNGRMKDEFLATLSHELRTPLNAILGWAQIVRRSGDDPATLAEGLTTIERNARTQAQIIEDLLDMSRIISGKVRLDVRRVDLAEVVKAAVDTCRPAADAKGIRVQPVLDPHAGPVSGDPNRLQQVFWNLLSNAVKFTPKGGRVQVRLERVDSHVEVSVTDTGEGIGPEFLPHVFDRFRQADASTTRRHGGLGLGLAIVKQLAELHGGSVRATSAGPGFGTSFTVTLPPTVVDPEPAGDPDGGGRRHPRAGGSPPGLGDLCASIAGVRVLVVDDEPDARALVRRVLEDCGAVVATAGSVAEALDRLRADRPDVLVSDIGMPGADGYTLIRQVRALGPAAGGDVPALALTAYARAEDRMKAVLAGFQMHVPKPVEPAELVTMIASLAGRTRA
jgi:PAS domain S-box-containing protein